MSISLLAWTLAALYSSLTCLLKFRMACSTGEINGGGCCGSGVEVKCGETGGA